VAVVTKRKFIAKEVRPFTQNNYRVLNICRIQNLV
jgi:hypothetical protein